jgi:hypothetical protein
VTSFCLPAGGANKRHRYAGLHVHDLGHTGNQFAANSGAGLRATATSRMRGAGMATRATPPGPLANGTTPDESPKRSKAQHSEIASDLGLHVGADDGNRTRTVSLGS